MSYNVPKHRMQNKRDLKWEPREGSRKDRKEAARQKRYVNKSDERIVEREIRKIEMKEMMKAVKEQMSTMLHSGWINLPPPPTNYFGPTPATPEWSWFNGINDSVIRFHICNVLGRFRLDEMEVITA